MSTTPEQIWAIEAAKIQARCCCQAYNERECYRLRYPPDADDWHLEEDDDDYCGCVCHAELEELSADLWPDEL